MKKTIYFLLIFLIPKICFALDANTTHPWIAEQAAKGVWPCERWDPKEGCICLKDSPPQACKEFKEYLGEMTTDREGNPIPVEEDTILWGSRDEDYTWGYPLRNIPV